jgi:hypothetical protein
MIAISWSSNAALVSVRGRTRAVGNRTNGRAPAHQGMRAGRPAVIGQGGIENAVKTRGIIAIRGGGDVGDTRSKVIKGLARLKPAHAIDKARFDQKYFKDQRHLVLDA